MEVNGCMITRRALEHIPGTIRAPSHAPTQTQLFALWFSVTARVSHRFATRANGCKKSHINTSAYMIRTAPPNTHANAQQLPQTAPPPGKLLVELRLSWLPSWRQTRASMRSIDEHIYTYTYKIVRALSRMHECRVWVCVWVCLCVSICGIICLGHVSFNVIDR